MAKANVRISTAKVLDLLRIKAKEAAKQLAEIPALEKKYKAAVAAWEKKVVASVPKTAKPDKVDTTIIRYGELEGQIRVELTYYVPIAKVGDFPERGDIKSEYYLKQNLDELEKTIKLLELTDDETVSASVYRNLADLL